jgi:predicted transcriptional regulator
MIEDQGQVTRQTASKHLAQLTDRGLTKSISDGTYELKAGGKIILCAFETCFDAIDPDRLTHLTRSKHTIPLLHTLSDVPSRPSELATRSEDSPSRATVRRAVRLFENERWIEELDGEYQLTTAGERTLDAYEELAVTIEQVMEKAPWFQRLSPIRTDIPVRALSDAKLYVSSPHSPGIVLATALKLCDPRLDRFRVLTSIFNPTLFTAYDKLLKLGLKGEAIVDASLYNRLHEEEMEYFLDDSDYENFQIFCLDEELTLGIGIYDEEQIAIGAYNETGGGEHIAMLLSSNDAVVQWGDNLYNHYRKQARRTDDRSPETVG